MIHTGESRAVHSGSAVLVAYFFPPFNIIAAQRALRMARALLRRYRHVVVITIPPDCIPESHRDESFGAELTGNPRLHLVYARPRLSGYGVVARPRPSHRIVGAALARLLCSPGVDWLPAVSAALDRACGDGPPGILVATGGPFVPFVAAARSARRSEVPLILDYRDLWSANPRSPYTRAARAFVRSTLENYANRRSDVVTTVSEGCRDSIVAGGGARDVRVLPNTPDAHYSDWFSSVVPESRRYDRRDLMHIALTGTIYPQCTCRVLLKAMVLMRAELRARVRLHYYGGSAGIVVDDAAAVGLQHHIVNHGLVSKREAVAAVRGADMLLSLVSDEPGESGSREVQGLMTTKIFDYLLSGRPIINIGPPESDVVRFVRTSGYAEFRNFAGDQVDELARYLSLAVARLEETRQLHSHADLADFGVAFERILDDVENRA